MQRKKQAWAAASLIATPIGLAVGRLHLIGPNPATYFVLGVLATLSVVGIVYGFWEARRVVRSNAPIGNQRLF